MDSSAGPARTVPIARPLPVLPKYRAGACLPPTVSVGMSAKWQKQTYTYCCKRSVEQSARYQRCFEIFRHKCVCDQQTGVYGRRLHLYDLKRHGGCQLDTTATISDLAAGQ